MQIYIISVCTHTVLFHTPQIRLPFSFSVPTSSHSETHFSNESFSLNLLKLLRSQYEFSRGAAVFGRLVKVSHHFRFHISCRENAHCQLFFCCCCVFGGKNWILSGTKPVFVEAKRNLNDEIMSWTSLVSAFKLVVQNCPAWLKWFWQCQKGLVHGQCRYQGHKSIRASQSCLIKILCLTPK